MRAMKKDRIILHLVFQGNVTSNKRGYIINFLQTKFQCVKFVTCTFTPISTSSGPSWLWSYDSWIYNYLCNQCLSPLMLWGRISIRARCTTLCDKVCQWIATGRWFSPGPPVSSINQTDLYDITEILLKVALNTIKQTNSIFHLLVNSGLKQSSFAILILILKQNHPTQKVVQLVIIHVLNTHSLPLDTETIK